MPQPHHYKLVSFELCPFVERSRIALTEKGLAYELELIDLRHKPDWFLAVSPMGKVPVLLVDDQPIFESLVINELIEELHPEPRLFPADPLERAAARAWMIFANDQLMPAAYQAQLALAVERPQDAEKPLANVRAAFGKLEEELVKRKRQFFVGDTFGLVDTVYASFFRRWKVSEEWGGARLLHAFPALAAYADALLAHPSVVQVAIADLGPKMREALREHASK